MSSFIFCCFLVFFYFHIFLLFSFERFVIRFFGLLSRLFNNHFFYLELKCVFSCFPCLLLICCILLHIKIEKYYFFLCIFLVFFLFLISKNFLCGKINYHLIRRINYTYLNKLPSFMNFRRHRENHYRCCQMPIDRMFFVNYRFDCQLRFIPKAENFFNVNFVKFGILCVFQMFFFGYWNSI